MRRSRDRRKTRVPIAVWLASYRQGKRGRHIGRAWRVFPSERKPVTDAIEALPHQSGAFGTGDSRCFRRKRLCEFRVLGETGGQSLRLTREHMAVGEVSAFESLGVDPVVEARVLVGQNQSDFAVSVD